MKLLNASLTIALTASVAAGQWSDDPANNLVISDATSDQVQPMIAPTADGGCYISWFDGIANGFDVRLQKLDADGDEEWAHGGVLVIDRGFSSTQAYGLDVDAAGVGLGGGKSVRVPRYEACSLGAHHGVDGGDSAPPRVPVSLHCRLLALWQFGVVCWGWRCMWGLALYV